MKFKAIHNDDDHAKALAQIEKLLGADDGSQEQNDLEVLSILVEAYERAKYPIADADPIEMLEFAFEQRETTSEQKARIFGGANRLSEVMSRKRKLTIGMIRRAHDELDIPLDVLVREYAVETPGAPERGTRGLVRIIDKSDAFVVLEATAGRNGSVAKKASAKKGAKRSKTMASPRLRTGSSEKERAR